MESDSILRGLMDWASNIVRLPLKEGARENLEKQTERFRPEFLLFVEHVSELTLQNDNDGTARTFSLSREDGIYFLKDGENTTRHMVVKSIHELSSEAKADSRSLDDAGSEAKADSRSLDDAGKVPISWAAPIDRLNDPGNFWAFFPTETTSLLAGILNAPWKTNEDRQNLLEGPYNDELVEAAASMVADALPKLSIPEDPARHLDALPRRYESGDDDHSSHLRRNLNSILRNRNVVPDQSGNLRKTTEISYPPDGSIGREALQRWAEYDSRPLDWLHHSALTRNRMARLDSVGMAPWNAASIPRTTISEWLEALIKTAGSEQDNILASMAAIQTAVMIPEPVRGNNSLGEIVLTSSGSWVEPDPESVFLGGGDTSISGKMVHSELQADPETLSALRELGIRPASPEIAFKEAVSAWELWQSDWDKGYVSLQEYEARKDTHWDLWAKIYRDHVPEETKTTLLRLSNESCDKWFLYNV